MPIYAGWKGVSAVELDRQHGVKAGVITERLWRKFYIQNMTPRDAADQGGAERLQRAVDR